MEKIQTLEQLDKVGLKICEMLNVSIDKASVAIPETFQQFVYFTIVSDALSLVLLPLIAFVIWLLRYKLLNNKLGIVIDDTSVREFIDPISFFIALGISIVFTIVCGNLLFEILKAILAPNILIIEKFSQLMLR